MDRNIILTGLTTFVVGAIFGIAATFFILGQRVAVVETQASYYEKDNQEKDKKIKKIEDQLNKLKIDYRNEKETKKQIEDTLKETLSVKEKEELKKLLPFISVDEDGNFCLGKCD